MALRLSQMHEDFRPHHKVATASDRSFGLVMAAACALAAFVPWWRTGVTRWWAVVASVTLALLAVAWQAPLRPLNRLWMRLALALNKVTTPIVLGAMYFLVVTPVGRLARAFGHVWLPLQRDPDTPSYWRSRPTGESSTSMRNQY